MQLLQFIWYHSSYRNIVSCKRSLQFKFAIKNLLQIPIFLECIIIMLLTRDKNFELYIPFSCCSWCLQKDQIFLISFFPLFLLFLLIRGEEFIILHLVVFFFFLVNLVATCKVVGRSKLLFFVRVCVIAYKTHVRNESNVPTFFLCFGWEGEERGEGLWKPLSLFCFLICFMFFQKGLFCFLFVSWCKSNALEVKTQLNYKLVQIQMMKCQLFTHHHAKRWLNLHLFATM